MKNAVFLDVALVRSDVSEKPKLTFLRSVRLYLVTAKFHHISPRLFSLMIDALSSSETSALTIATRRNIPEDTILLYALFH
jgi:hypothetical protein